MEIVDMGALNTSRWIRMVLLRGVSQAEMGRRCRPKLPQASISHFDQAKNRMTWAMARRLAPAYAAEKSAVNLEVGAEAVWQIWFENVKAYGTPEMKRQATAIREAMGFNLPLLVSAHAHAPAAVQTIAPQPVQEVRLA